MAKLQLDDIHKEYGEFTAVESMNLEVKDSEFIVFLGPSGCGKTTTLRMIAGFIEPTRGRVQIGTRDLTAIPPYRRNLGIVFQNYAIFPHLTVFENVAFGLRRRKMDKDVIATKTQESLRRVKLDHLKDRLPKQLSGGQQQRVAIARALAIEPDVLLLDEPLSNLDAKLRHDVRHEIRSLQRDLGITTVMVTHDQDEALSLGDRLVVMDKGKVQQIGTPREIYETPVNLFVADFIGRTNVLKGAGTGQNQFKIDGGPELACKNGTYGASAVVIRPETLQLGAEATTSSLPAVIEDVTYLGSLCEVRLKLDAGHSLMATVNPGRDAPQALTPGGRIFVQISPSSAFAIAN